jgi:hypothetical protein
MHFSFNSVRITGLYVFRALLAHPQEALYRWNLVYCMRVVSWLHQDWSGILVQPTDITRTQYTKCRLCSDPEDEQVML